MYPHRIRLRGPWDCEPRYRIVVHPGGRTETVSDGLPPRCRMTMPCRWGEGGLGDFAGRVRFGRPFGWPGRHDAHERVWLTFAGAEASAWVWLNGQFLGEHKGGGRAFEFEVTGWLRVRNELTVEVEAPGGAGGLWGEVALAVRAAAFLRGGRGGRSRAGDGFGRPFPGV